MHFYHKMETRYMVQAGAVFKMVLDFSDPSFAEFTMDSEVDRSRLVGAPKLEKTMNQLW